MIGFLYERKVVLNMESIFTINDLISDAKLALESNAHFSALSLMFAIISECANVEYPDEWFNKYAENDEYLQKHFPSHYQNGKYNCNNHDRERFQMWIDDWENTHNCNDETLKQQMQEYKEWKDIQRISSNGLMPRENGELLYQLRCTLFHEASDNIEFHNYKKISDEGNRKISSDGFTLTLDAKNPMNIHSRGFYTTSSTGLSTMNINVNGLIYHYLALAELYVERNKNKKFNNIKVYDHRKEG